MKMKKTKMTFNETNPYKTRTAAQGQPFLFYTNVFLFMQGHVHHIADRIVSVQLAKV